jgi:lipoprotein-anchoring transpeptidase ErfK/SrfK
MIHRMYSLARPVRWMSICLSALVLCPASATAAASDPIHVSRPGFTSYWAFVEQATAVRRYPNVKSRSVARLGLRTSDRTDELVMILQEKENAKGEWWTQVRLPVLPNNTVGWVPSQALGELRTRHTHLIINRQTTRATLIRSGKVVFRARIGVGKSYWPTPRGEFYVRTRLRHAGGIYGAAAFGTSARSAVLTEWPGGGFIGLHGTDQPELIPGHISHGCVRFRNGAIRQLAGMIGPGTPITIR